MNWYERETDRVNNCAPALAGGAMRSPHPAMPQGLKDALNRLAARTGHSKVEIILESGSGRRLPLFDEKAKP